MTQYSSFFNAVETSVGTFDRTYNASQWADYFSSFVGTGVFQGDNNTSLQVQAGENLNIIIAAGKAFINGYYYKNDSPLTFTLSQANANYSRIDNICIELNLNNREITAVVVTGDPSPTPTGPQLIQNGLIYQLCIGQVLVQPLTTTITSQNITDTRANTALCGWVTGIVDSISLQDVTNHLENWFTEVTNLQKSVTEQTKQVQALANGTIGGSNLLVGQTYWENGLQSKNEYAVYTSPQIQLEKGITYTLTFGGWIDSLSTQNGKYLGIDIYNSSWSQCEHASIGSETLTFNNITITPLETEMFTVECYQISSLGYSASTGIVTLSSCNLQRGTRGTSWQLNGEQAVNNITTLQQETHLLGGTVSQNVLDINNNKTAIETLNATTVYTTVIPPKSDLNTYTATGLFSCSGSSDVASFQNAPNVYAGYLNVLAVGKNYAYQTWTDIFQNKYIRSYAFYTDTWSSWEKLNNVDIGGINLFEGKTHNGEWGTKSSSAQFCITPANLSGGIPYTLSVNASTTGQALSNGQYLKCYLVNANNNKEIYEIDFDEENTVTKRLTFTPSGGSYNFYGAIYPQKENNQAGIINWYNLQQGQTGTNWIPSLWDIKEMVNNSNIPLSQLSVIAPQVCKLSLDNNCLKKQNKALGEQVSKLTLANQEHTEQIRMLGMQLVENKLKK